MEHILFLFPIGKNIPTGGLKVVYDYACRLVTDGYQVSIAYAAYFDSTEKGFKRKVKAVAKFVYAKIVFGKKGYTWYKKNKCICEKFIWKPVYEVLPKADIYIATSVNSAPYVAKIPVDDSRKFYFIQGYESFIVNDDSFIRWTYRLSLRKIVISQWLSRLVAAEGQKCWIIPNGFDFNIIKLTIPVECKDKYLVSMLYHVNVCKDVGVGMEAVEIARREIPQLRLVMFGAYPRPEKLPDWITYYQKPSDEIHLEINNRAAIYVGCSRVEGWGLTIGEAMICGQAVACTDNDGYKEMAIDGLNALVTPVGDAGAMAQSIVKLVKDDKLRIKLACKGIETIKKFDFEKSYELFKECIMSVE